MGDDERPRKSWREIDKAKDRSAHRQEERPDFEDKRKGAQRKKSYKAALDRLFDSGKIADLVEAQTALAGKKGKGGKGSKGGKAPGGNRIKMLATIRDAGDREEVTQATDAFLDKFGEVPDDLEILGRMLEHRNPSRQMDAMERIDSLLDTEQPKRTRAMVGQLKMIRDIGDDPEMMQLASKLIERLE
jgi:hypothetical protein